MIALFVALLFALQSPPDEARMQRIGPYVPACIQGKALPDELIETCAERLAVLGDAAAIRRAEETAEALSRWGEPCDGFTSMTNACPAERILATHARSCIARRPDDETLETCVLRLEDRRLRADAIRSEAARPSPAPPPPVPEPESAPQRDPNGCRRERVVSPDGQSVSYSLQCSRSWSH